MQHHLDSHERMVNIYTHMKILLATAALQWWQQPGKLLNNYRPSKEYYAPPLSKVDHLYNEYHNNFILVEDWSKPVKISAHFRLIIIQHLQFHEQTQNCTNAITALLCYNYFWLPVFAHDHHGSS